jgi:hypothetical protein
MKYDTRKLTLFKNRSRLIHRLFRNRGIKNMIHVNLCRETESGEFMMQNAGELDYEVE